jgi:hypothetical protein
MPLNFG